MKHLVTEGAMGNVRRFSIIHNEHPAIGEGKRKREILHGEHRKKMDPDRPT